ncbi:MAG: hypothetical protein OEU76_05715 [Cyclobacteriaceae bacterium]|nr:hypothetical protein [Cyclobacteriaceae bacterium]
MKKLLMKYMTLVVLVSLVACSGKKEEAVVESSSDSDEWPMMDEFHMVMAESFHPYKDSANIAPAVSLASEMAALADKWSTSELPGKVNNDEVKAHLALLKTETAAFVVTSQSGDEQQIGQALTNLHDLFHKLQEAWYGAHGHQH